MITNEGFGRQQQLKQITPTVVHQTILERLQHNTCVTMLPHTHDKTNIINITQTNNLYYKSS